MTTTTTIIATMTITKNITNIVGSITVCLDLEASIIKKIYYSKI